MIDPLGLTRTFLPRLTTPADGDTALAPAWIGRRELPRLVRTAIGIQLALTSG